MSEPLKPLERIVRTQEEINEVMQWAEDALDQGTHYAGMSYEEGITAMYNWLMGDNDDRPDDE